MAIMPRGREHPHANEAERPQRRSAFRRALGGIGWLAAAPVDWAGARSISRAASLIGGLARAMHVRPRLDPRFKVGDASGFDLTGGEASDSRHFDILLDIGPDIEPRAVITDKGYSSKANRAAARARGVAPVIPHKHNEKDKPAFFPKTLYKARARIEQAFGRLKRFKRIALRCEKPAANFRSIVSFAAGLCLIKFVHTA